MEYKKGFHAHLGPRAGGCDALRPVGTAGLDNLAVDLRATHRSAGDGEDQTRRVGSLGPWHFGDGDDGRGGWVHEGDDAVDEFERGHAKGRLAGRVRISRRRGRTSGRHVSYSTVVMIDYEWDWATWYVSSSSSNT